MPNPVILALSDRNTGILPVRENNASSLSAHATTGWKPVVHDRQDAYPPAKLAVLGASPAHGAPRLNRSGLANMRRRMDEIGARIDIRSQPAAGTTVTFDLPLP